MSVIEATDPDSSTWRLQGRTTIDLYENERGEWQATQHDVDVVGHGRTAAAAVVDYCQRLAER